MTAPVLRSGHYFCPSCDAEVDADARICPSCHTALSAPSAADRLADIRKLLKRARWGLGLAIAGAAISIGGWLFSLIPQVSPRSSAEHSDPSTKPEVATFEGKPGYVADVFARKEGWGFVVAFTLKTSSGLYCCCGGTAILSVNDHFYGWSGENYRVLLRDTIRVVVESFLVAEDGPQGAFPFCWFPRVDLSKCQPRIHDNSLGSVVVVRFIPTPGDTLIGSATASWPWES